MPKQQANNIESIFLPSATIIDEYMIERGLAKGGFSYVYLARQLDDQVQVAIKEYLPRKLAYRNDSYSVDAISEQTRPMFFKGRKLFFDEAKALASLKHPNIVDVINFFQANSTVYMVMIYDYGITLDKLLRDKKIEINTENMIHIFGELLNGIEIIHQNNLVHLDIKPANILIRPNHSPMLLDFGAIQPYPITEQKSRSQVLTKGFSPIEQYMGNGDLGPWTDIYAIGSSMRACLERKAPQESPSRLKEDKVIPAIKEHKKRLSPSLLEAIDWAMEIQPDLRPQSIKEFQDVLLHL